MKISPRPKRNQLHKALSNKNIIKYDIYQIQIIYKVLVRLVKLERHGCYVDNHKEKDTRVEKVMV